MDQLFKVLQLEEIEDHPMGNIVRGDIHDTTSLQDMIKEEGLIQPLTVEEENGRYYLIAGYRRRHALNRLGIKSAPCFIRRSGNLFSLKAMAAANRFEPQPELILDGDSNPVGGLAYVVYLEKDATKAKNHEIAASLGIPTDTIGAYIAIVTEFPELRERFAKGDIAPTVYSRFKTQPEEIKRYILRKQGKITIGYVRDILANWDEIEKQEELDDPPVAEDTDLVDDAEDYQPETVSATQCLNEALHWLSKIEPGDLFETDFIIIEKIQKALEELE